MSDSFPVSLTNETERPFVAVAPLAVGGSARSDAPCESNPDDNHLIRLIAENGDRVAFHTLHERHRMFLRIKLQRRFPRFSGSDDAIQETWIAVWDHAKTFKGGEFRPWLWTIAYRKAISIIRKQGSGPETEPLGERDLAAENDCLIDEEFLAAFCDCLATALTEEERELVKARVSDQSYDEILAVLPPVDSDKVEAKRRLYNLWDRAKKKLQVCIARKIK